MKCSFSRRTYKANVLGTLMWFIFLAKVLLKDSAPQEIAKKKLQCE